MIPGGVIWGNTMFDVENWRAYRYVWCAQADPAEGTVVHVAAGITKQILRGVYARMNREGVPRVVVTSRWSACVLALFLRVSRAKEERLPPAVVERDVELLC